MMGTSSATCSSLVHAAITMFAYFSLWQFVEFQLRFSPLRKAFIFIWLASCVCHNDPKSFCIAKYFAIFSLLYIHIALVVYSFSRSRSLHLAFDISNIASSTFSAHGQK